ncbi:MAG TPA: IS200/IS605 family transposase [Pyrinomonadaceae bacterium]|jgi:REP element-mobilizing transposase RayT
MAHTFTNLLVHVIFSTKGRLPFIDSELKPQLHAYIGGIIREGNGKAYVINGMADHVHILASLPPTIALSDAMRTIKTNSSRRVHERWHTKSNFGWQTGYGAFSVSRSSVPEVTRYIIAQEEHHSKMTFQQEFLAFLEKHGIKYDERYIWE